MRPGMAYLKKKKEYETQLIGITKWNKNIGNIVPSLFVVTYYYT